MMTYKTYSSQSVWRMNNQFRAMKDFFGEDKALWRSLTSGDPYHVAGLSHHDNKDGTWVDMYYLATDDSYKVDYATAMAIYKKFHDKALEMRDKNGVPFVWHADGFNRNELIDGMLPIIARIPEPMVELVSEVNVSSLDKVRTDIHMLINRFDGCWLTSPMPTIGYRRESSNGEPRLSFTFGKKVHKKNRLAFQVYVITHADDYMV